MSDAPILSVGQPMLPDRELLNALCEEMISTEYFSNGGSLHARFESALDKTMQVPQHRGSLALTSSGTMAVMMALQLGNLPRGGEVITSPLSFPATVQAIIWCGFTPVFADVDPRTLTLCPEATRLALTPRTVAILGVHLVGVPCAHEALAEIAKEHGLWLAYDGAQSPDISVEDTPLWTLGNASAISLHATKMLHSCEGGAVLTPKADDQHALARMRHFGMSNGNMTHIGTNGKMSEINAAMGLALLPKLPAEMETRRRLRDAYDEHLSGVNDLVLHSFPHLGSPSLLYYAVRLPAALRSSVYMDLLNERVISRPGFPILCGEGTFCAQEEIHTTLPTAAAHAGSEELLCLPLHGRMNTNDVKRVADRIKKTVREQ